MQQLYFSDKIKYVTDKNGSCKEVIIPVNLWKRINQELETLREKQAILLGLEQACREVKLQQKGELPEQTLEEFIDEL